MRYTEVDKKIGRLTAQEKELVRKARRQQAAREELDAKVEATKTKVKDFGLNTMDQGQSLLSQGWNWIKANPTETLVGIMAIAVMDIEDQLDDIS